MKHHASPAFWKAYEALPVDLQRILDYAAYAMNATGLADYEVKNATALVRLRTEFKAKVEILPLPAETMKELKKLALEVVKEESEKSPMAKKVYASYQKFDAVQTDWGHISEAPYHNLIAG